jgi:hypothetical protein
MNYFQYTHQTPNIPPTSTVLPPAETPQPLIPQGGSMGDVLQRTDDLLFDGHVGWGAGSGGGGGSLPLTGGVLTGPLQVPAGSSVAPTLAIGTPGTGLFGGGNSVLVAANSNAVWQFTPTQAQSVVPINMSGQSITALAAPALATDAANKGYIDGLTAALDARITALENAP